jgi:2-amino-4-hydroxy-6-hydroxymethyldihydropteridine diphosphokinase
MSEPGSTITVLGLGANLGDRLANLRGAVASLAEENIQILERSHVYETPPAGGPPQPDYLNAAVKVAAPFDLAEVLARCLAIERRFGRVRPDPVRNGPRPLDLDILWAAGGPVTAGDLVVPHPRLHLRPFALVPLLEVMPDARDGDGRRYADLDVARAAIRPVDSL